MGAGRDRLPPSRRGGRGLRGASPRDPRRRRELRADRPGALGDGAALPGRRWTSRAGRLPRAPGRESRLARRDRPRAARGGRRARPPGPALPARSPRRLGRARSSALAQLGAVLARTWATRWAPLPTEYAGPIPYASA